MLMNLIHNMSSDIMLLKLLPVTHFLGASWLLQWIYSFYEWQNRVILNLYYLRFLADESLSELAAVEHKPCCFDNIDYIYMW